MLPLKYVPPADFKGEDYKWLTQADLASPDYHKLPIERIVQELYLGQMLLFRFQPGPGVLLVETTLSAAGKKRLRLVRAGGHGVGWTFRQLAELLQHTAREYGCEQVESVVYDERLAKAMERVGAVRESVTMVLEV